MKSMIKVLNEQFKSIYLISRLSIYQVKSTNKNNYLGMLWELINPMIQISIYWFVFGLGLRGDRASIGQFEFFPWLLGGIIVWFYINPAVLEGSKSIYKRIKMISKMNFPMSVIPTYIIISKFYSHLMIVGIAAIVLMFFGIYPSVYIIQLVYYMFATTALLFALSLVTSTLSTIVRDVQMLMQAVMRMLLYLSPILWSPEANDMFEKMDFPVVMIMKINPFYYIVEGYRASMLGTSWHMIENLGYTFYFWGFVLLLLAIGSAIHLKFRNHFIDYL